MSYPNISNILNISNISYQKQFSELYYPEFRYEDTVKSKVTKILEEHNKTTFYKESYTKKFSDIIDLKKYELEPIIPPPPQPLKLLPDPFESKCRGLEFEKLILVDRPIPEDSIFLKLLSCIPLFGIIPAVINECSLQKKAQQTEDPARLIKVINVKNHYKIASIARKLLTVALIITGVALGVLTGGLGIGVAIGAAIIGSCFVSIYSYRIHKNKQLIHELQTTGFRPNMYVR